MPSIVRTRRPGRVTYRDGHEPAADHGRARRPAGDRPVAGLANARRRAGRARCGCSWERASRWSWRAGRERAGRRCETPSGDCSPTTRRRPSSPARARTSPGCPRRSSSAGTASGPVARPGREGRRARRSSSADLGDGPGGTWGERARIAIRALSVGYSMLATVSADRLEDVFERLGGPPVEATEDELSRLGLVLVLDEDGRPRHGRALPAAGRAGRARPRAAPGAGGRRGVGRRPTTGSSTSRGASSPSWPTGSASGRWSSSASRRDAPRSSRRAPGRSPPAPIDAPSTRCDAGRPEPYRRSRSLPWFARPPIPPRRIPTARPRSASCARPAGAPRTVKEELRANLVARLAAGSADLPRHHRLRRHRSSRRSRTRSSPARTSCSSASGARRRPGSPGCWSACSTSGCRSSAAASSTTTRSRPISAAGREIVAQSGDDTPIDWLPRDRRYAEKLATPDITIADLIGEVDPIRVAEGRYLSDELDAPLRPHPARQPRDLRDERAARPRRADPGRPAQHPRGARRPGPRVHDPAAARPPRRRLGEPGGLHEPRPDHHAAQGPARVPDPDPLPAHRSSTRSRSCARRSRRFPEQAEIPPVADAGVHGGAGRRAHPPRPALARDQPAQRACRSASRSPTWRCSRRPRSSARSGCASRRRRPAISRPRRRPGRDDRQGRGRDRGRGHARGADRRAAGDEGGVRDASTAARRWTAWSR